MPFIDINTLVTIVRIDLIGESVGAAICFLIAYYARRAAKLSGQRSITLLFSGFLLIGVGLLIHVALLALIPLFRFSSPPRPIGLPESPPFLDFLLALGNGAHWGVEGIGYVLVFSAYVLESRSKVAVGAALLIGPIDLARQTVNPLFDIFTLVLLVAILVEVIDAYRQSGRRNTLFVITAFLLLILAHLGFIFFRLTSFDITVYVLAHAFQLSGFLILLVALTRKAPVD